MGFWEEEIQDCLEKQKKWLGRVVTLVRFYVWMYERMGANIGYRDNICLGIWEAV